MSAAKQTVVVGMSGGVDSSLSAALLQEAGYEVIGLFMKNWEEQDAKGVCKASLEYEDVLRTCDHLKIPSYSVPFVEEYQNRVFASFLADLKLGLTPNPDILCNREIKFDALLAKAFDLGAQFLATGHYARTERGQLLKGIDPTKDQSYFLHAVKKRALLDVLFPVGHLHKKEVRSEARKRNLPTALKKDSTGICFIGKRDFKPFVAGYLGYNPGPLETLDGKVIGEHDGAAYYTIGQRKGLKLGGEGEPWYVIGKDMARNAVLVDRGEQHLFASELTATQFTWIDEPPPNPLRAKAKIRYRQQEQPCTLTLHDDLGTIHFDTPQRAITPGQSIVFYSDDVCLGGARIER